ncbi:hypothetical protein QTG56_22965 (plasmid) [Rossellomorea sp. AcN35-11]|nr:hypothetical protein [Rossellomorea aquimaris]WJV32230.1 hypothetical protein QTG56_22965 [Rossellomorea sp. AcN35-11]
MRVINCNNCGKLFNTLGRLICLDCKKEEDEVAYEVRKYLKKNPDASANDVCEEVDVSMDFLSKLIDENRIIMKRRESPISCQICGQQISRARICSECANQLSEGLGKQESEKTQVTTRYFNKKR